MTIADSAIATRSIDFIEARLRACDEADRAQFLDEALAEWHLIVATWPRFWHRLAERELKLRHALAVARDPGRYRDQQLAFWKSVFPPKPKEPLNVLRFTAGAGGMHKSVDAITNIGVDVTQTFSLF